MLLGLATTFLVTVRVAQGHGPQQSDLNNHHAAHREILIRQQFASLRTLLHTAKALADRDPSISQTEWNAYFANHNAPYLVPGRGHILAVHQMGDRAIPTLIAPRMPGNLMAGTGISVDFWAIPAFRQAMERARSKDEASLSAPTRIPADAIAPEHLGLFLPLAPARRNQQPGWVAIVLPVTDFLHVLGELPGGDAQWLLSDTSLQTPMILSGSTIDAPFAQRTFRLGGRTWLLKLRLQNPSTEAPYPLLTPGTTFLLGISTTLVVVLVTWTMAISRHRAHRMARRMSHATTRALTRFQHLVQKTPLALIEWDREGTIVAWNPAAERVFGHKADQAIGQNGFSLLFPGGTGESFSQAFKDALAGEVPPTALACATRKNGAPVLGEWSHVPTKSGKALIQGVTSLVLDVTHKHEADEHLKQYQRLESLGVLAGGIAHDFNNLLGIMTGYLDQATQTLDTDAGTAKSMLEKVDHALMRAAGLARQMLAYAGKAPARIEPVNLNETLALTLDHLRPGMPRLIQVETTIEPELPPVRMDPAQLQQVIMNLITNAWEAVGEKPGHIKIRTRKAELTTSDVRRLPPGLPMPTGAAVVFEVEDDGCGMDRETLHHIFDPFYSTKFQGRGLGLSVILGILRTHGASLRVKSLKGAGSTFRVLLPIQPHLDIPYKKQDSFPSQVQATTVLIADDEPLLRELARRAVEVDGHVPILAADGHMALELYQANSESIALAILDVTMPKLGGLEVLERIRAMSPDLPIILSSGYSDQAIPRLPGVIFLPKPYRIQHLRDAVARQLRKAPKPVSPDPGRAHLVESGTPGPGTH